MRVLICADAVGGVWTYAAELRDALTRRGVEVTLVAVGPQAPPSPGVRHHACRLEWQEDPWDDVARSGSWLLEVADDVRPDVVHLNGYAHAVLPWPAPCVVVAHSCVLSWYRAVRGGDAPARLQPYRATVRAGLRAADAVVAPTHAMLEEVRRIYGLGPATGAVIGNGVNAPPHPPAPDRRPVVLGAGRLWDEAKGAAVLDEAAKGLPWPVEIAGAAGTAAHARLLGALPRDELRALMGEAAIFAHPATYEPYGLAVLEAALGGCALVLGDIPSLRELWDGAALFCDPLNEEELHAALQRLIERPRERDVLAAAALDRARGRDAAAMARDYAALYEAVLAREAAVA